MQYVGLDTLLKLLMKISTTKCAHSQSLFSSSVQTFFFIADLLDFTIVFVSENDCIFNNARLYFSEANIEQTEEQYAVFLFIYSKGESLEKIV